jgi:D-2-hydroxyacid dehydrogenase (NADP+)
MQGQDGMTKRALPRPDEILIGFAHPSYALSAALAKRAPGLQTVDLHSLEEVEARIGELHVLGQSSAFWSNRLLEGAGRLVLIQSLSVGVNHYDCASLRARGIRLANAQGCVDIAVAEHAMGLLLTLSRKLHRARDNQARRFWRPMQTQAVEREFELNGLCLVVVGLGQIGSRLAALARAFGMHVIAIRNDPKRGRGPADEVYSYRDLAAVLPRADCLVLACPLNAETENLIDARALTRLKPGALLVNVARGRVVDEVALVEALRGGGLAGAGLDCFHAEPLPPTSPLWGFDNVLITPHSAGETSRYEARLIEILLTNLERLWSGKSDLFNEIV